MFNLKNDKAIVEKDEFESLKERNKALKWRLHTAFIAELAYNRGDEKQKDRLLRYLLSVLDAQMFVMEAENELEMDALIEADAIIRKALGVTENTERIVSDSDSIHMRIPEIRTMKVEKKDNDIEDVVMEMIGNEEE